MTNYKKDFADFSDFLKDDIYFIILKISLRFSRGSFWGTPMSLNYHLRARERGLVSQGSAKITPMRIIGKEFSLQGHETDLGFWITAELLSYD